MGEIIQIRDYIEARRRSLKLKVETQSLRLALRVISSNLFEVLTSLPNSKGGEREELLRRAALLGELLNYGSRMLGGS